jgi:hypothetical protein
MVGKDDRDPRNRCPAQRRAPDGFGLVRPQLGGSLRCPPTPLLDGKLAVVTGATGGIGVEIARGLAGRGAELILPCRNPAKGERVAHQLRTTADSHQPAQLAPIDLENLDSVRAQRPSRTPRQAGRSM